MLAKMTRGILSVLALTLLLSAIGEADEIGLEELCRSGSLKVSEAPKLNSISHMRSLAKQIREVSEHDEQHVCQPYRLSLVELDPILEVVETGHVCNLELVDQMRQFQLKFLSNEVGSKKAESGDEQLLLVPTSVRQFFIALGFQISAECKISLIMSLDFYLKDLITEEDYKIIEQLESSGATLLDQQTELEDFDDIVLLKDLNSLQSEQADKEHDSSEFKLLIKAKTNGLMQELINKCKQKFRPVYSKLILPLIELSNLGYNYQGEILNRELEELKHNKLVRRWYNIVQTCETFGTMEIYEDPDKLAGDRQVFTFISREEAEQLAKEAENSQSSNVEPIKFETDAEHEGDKLWIQSQAELDKLVRGYKANASEASRIKRKLVSKLFKKAKEALMTGKVFTFVSDLVKANQKENAHTNVNEDLVMLMDEAVSDSEIQVSAIDTPVAGFKKKKAYPTRRPDRHMFKTSQTKFSTRIFEATFGKLLISKLDLFFWIIGIVGVLLILVAISTLAAPMG